ncbi:VOC family protein [Roseicella frigidaeris]|nr:VOC family protein [Roseicella frigidaeris]
MAIPGRQGIGQLGVTLIVQQVAAAADFYRDVLGAEEVDRGAAAYPGGPPPAGLPAGEVTWAELRLAGAHLLVVRENPRWREAPRPDWPRSPIAAGAPSTCLTLYVDDVDAVYARALAAGASPTARNSGVEDGYWGDRMVQFHDPFGHVWRIMTRREDVEVADLPGRYEALRQAHRAARGLG